MQKELEEIRLTISIVKSRMSNIPLTSDYSAGLSLLQTKNQCLVSYLMLLVQFITLKVTRIDILIIMANRIEINTVRLITWLRQKT